MVLDGSFRDTVDLCGSSRFFAEFILSKAEGLRMTALLDPSHRILVYSNHETALVFHPALTPVNIPRDPDILNPPEAVRKPFS